jgi:hypothetical protein
MAGSKSDDLDYTVLNTTQDERCQSFLGLNERSACLLAGLRLIITILSLGGVIISLDREKHTSYTSILRKTMSYPS